MELNLKLLSERDEALMLAQRSHVQQVVLGEMMLARKGEAKAGAENA